VAENQAGDWITIAANGWTARINPLGAELSSITDPQGREWMTDADPAYWTGRAPILFPVVGAPFRETIRVDGRDYPMAKHGFARRSRFDVVEASDARAAFELRDSDGTRAHYPFGFRLRLLFAIEGPALTVTAEIENPDAERDLFASLGFHPAFAWPLPGAKAKTDARVLFGSDEPDALKAIAPDGTIADAEVPSPLDGRELRLRDELFAHDALVWDRVRSSELTYGEPDGPNLHLRFDAPKLGIWTKPGAAFLCLEPWHGIADPEGYTGEYRTKPGVFAVAPGATWRTAITITPLP